MMRGTRTERDGGTVPSPVFYLFTLTACGTAVTPVAPVYLVVDDPVVGETMHALLVEPTDRLVCHFFKVDSFKNGQIFVYLFIRVGTIMCDVPLLNVSHGAVTVLMVHHS